MEYLYGRNSVLEALRAGRRPVRRVLVARGAQAIGELVAEAHVHRVPVEAVERHRLDSFGGSHHQGVVAEAEPFPYAHLEQALRTSDAPLVLALDSLQDPQNFGTLLRTAQATGVDAVLIPEHRAVSVTPAVSNASAGAVEHLQVVRVTNLTRSLQQLKSNAVWTFGLAVDAEQPYWSADLSGAVAIVVGSEGSGLGRLVRETCDILLNIPMAAGSVQSLNASVAGSLVLYEAFRQRGATLTQK
ncbi:MAG: 23S rRNA (guanosine(2251)-2'-O)-methyltransferase RlmB [Chloroflexi bacterium]|nr:23S rRNA (guanosine(2251)-2'-O)-methyltransferase RlmB [Chloroflexota bacterium]